MRLDVARLYAFAWRVAGRLPGAVVRGLCAAAADASWATRRGGVRQLEANYARMRPELDPRELRRLSRAGMRSYMRYFGEAFTLTSLTPERVDARVRASGVDGIRRYLDDDRAVVLALGHLGNWDLAGAWATRNLGPVTTVAERLKPEQLFQEFLAFRESIGLRILALGDGDVFRELVRTGRAGAGLIPLLADRDLTAKGIEVDFAGHRARVAAGPAALAVAAKAALSTTVITYERLHGARRRAAGSPWGIHIAFGEPQVPDPELARADQVRALTQAWAHELAAGIRQRPEDWHMLQKVFIEDLDPQRYAETLAQEASA
ncbi:phosphatidylinositol mannoside acyltransferase [Cellulomonas edaphi]|uniref:Phosphatidylinositol mannoside acyltransferase n=1 Tax=Cellulomonas edaphi TaxID=3053468 RepID=A0ABT7S6P1_9CELL|nr:phosphatidylinositol mannoside acyltransferase [Cellulomons edaphi]MDM7831285.1 phosphatidylinositol mannoside acyltransferase [Cellulomons edaphi]